MPAPERTSPGWYPDPAGPHPAGPARTLRYWDGRAWTDRRRPHPVLTTLELSGLAATAATQERRAIERPVRAPELPAPARPAEIAATGHTSQEAPAGRANPDAGAPPPATQAKAGGSPPVPPEPPAPPPPPPGPSGGDPGAPSRSRRKWWFLAGVAVLAALTVALAGQALKPRSPGPLVLTDRHFVQLANAECTRTMANLRPPDGGPLGSAELPAQTAAHIDDAAAGLDALANRLAALPASDADRPHITGWLDGWHGFVSVGHKYADYLRRHGANQDKPPAVLQTGAQLARTADNFAHANGISDCTFAVVPLMDPSRM